MYFFRSLFCEKILLGEGLEAFAAEKGGGGHVVADTEDHVGTVGIGRGKGVGVLDIHAAGGKDLHDVGKTAGGMGNGHREDIRQAADVTGILNDLGNRLGVLRNEAEDSEILGVCDGEGVEVDVLSAEDGGNIGELALFVLEKYGDLLNHGDYLL